MPALDAAGRLLAIASLIIRFWESLANATEQDDGNWERSQRTKREAKDIQVAHIARSKQPALHLALQVSIVTCFLTLIARLIIRKTLNRAIIENEIDQRIDCLDSFATEGNGCQQMASEANISDRVNYRWPLHVNIIVFQNQVS